MDPSPDTYWGAPSLRMWSDGGTFLAGIYTQVGGLTPGATYNASMGWGAPYPWQGDNFGRRLGIDPTGGTDPNSPNIVWGPMQRGPGKVLNDSNPGYPNIDVSAVARGSTVTVFVWVDHNYSTGQNQIFIDAVGLYQNADAPVVVATDTPPPQGARCRRSSRCPDETEGRCSHEASAYHDPDADSHPDSDAQGDRHAGTHCRRRHPPRRQPSRRRHSTRRHRPSPHRRRCPRGPVRPLPLPPRKSPPAPQPLRPCCSAALLRSP